jgi:hypothetical protein
VLDNAELQSPSPQPDGPPTGESTPSPVAEPEERSDGRSWWSRFLHTRGHQSDRSDDVSEEPEQDGHEPIAPASRTVTLSEDELQQRVRREAQSLHDREAYRRQREAAEAERKRLRDEDPWQYAQQDKQREDDERARTAQTQQLMELLGHTARQHDAASVDPVLFSLPEKERERILGLPNAGLGLDGRKLVVTEALKTYGRLEYDRGYREAQAKLRKDPVFRKSVLHELRGYEPEPELYPGDSPRESPEDNVSNRLRSAFYQR